MASAPVQAQATSTSSAALHHLPVALFTVSLLVALQPLSTDLYLPSLPGLTRYFGTTVSAVQWTLTLFILAFGCAQLIAGPLSDRFGRRPVALGATALYTAASLLCVLAPSLPVLVAGRVLQAVGACTALVCARALVRDVTTPEQGARLLAKVGAIMTAAPVLGPLLGGVLEAQFNWRASFTALTLAGAVALWAVARHVQETNRFKNPHALAPRPLARTYAQIARHRGFWAYTLAATASYGGLVAYLSGSSQVAQLVLHMSAQSYGLAFALCTLGYLAGALLCRRWVTRLGIQATMQRGALCALTGAACLLAGALAGVQHPLALFVPQTLYLLGHGLIQPCAQSGSVAHFGQQAGSAAALMGFFMMLAATLIVFWTGASFNGTMLPLAMAIFAAACSLCAVVFGLVWRDGALPG
jgi:MFS transporter, DHA1 family, multidrug resistance protein